MNSVRAIMGATQVGGRGSRKGSRKGSRVYGGLQTSSYNYDCNCWGDDAQNNNGNGKIGYGSTASMPLPPKKNSINTGLIGPSKNSVSQLASTKPLSQKPVGANSSSRPPTSSKKSSNKFATQNPFGTLAPGQLGDGQYPNGYKSGGARKRKARKATSSRKANAEKYRKFLDGLDVKRLQKIAKTKGIKITKKKDGKTVYCKKATIVSKLFKFKYGK